MHRPQFDTSAAMSRERYWSKMTGFGAKLMRYGASYPDKKTCLGTRWLLVPPIIIIIIIHNFARGCTVSRRKTRFPCCLKETLYILGKQK